MNTFFRQLAVLLVFIVLFHVFIPINNYAESTGTNEAVTSPLPEKPISIETLELNGTDPTITEDTYSNLGESSNKTRVENVSTSVYLNNPVTKKYLIKFGTHATKNSFIQDFMKKRKPNSRLLKEYKNFNNALFELTDDEYSNLFHDSNVLKVEPDYPITVSGEVYSDSETLTWGYEALNTQSLHNSGILGSGIKIAIVDTGIDLDHPELHVSGGTSLLSDSFNDDNGHGTQIKSTPVQVSGLNLN